MYVVQSITVEFHHFLDWGKNIFIRLTTETPDGGRAGVPAITKKGHISNESTRLPSFGHFMYLDAAKQLRPRFEHGIWDSQKGHLAENAPINQVNQASVLEIN